MKAAVRVAPRRIELRDVPEPVAGEGEALIRIDRVALCGGDLKYFRDEGAAGEGFVVCHEAVGSVVSAPAGSLEPGELVTVDPQARCGECRYCRSGAIELCVARRDMGYTADGAARTLVTLPVERVVRVPAGVAVDAAAATHGLASVLHALSRVELDPVERALIVGPGPAGLTFGLALRAWRPDVELTIAGRGSPRLALAEELGMATIAVDREDLAALRYEALPSGFDLVVETSGASDVRALAPRLVRPGGTLLAYAGGAYEVDGGLVGRRQLRLVGSTGAGTEMKRAADLLAAGEVALDRIISHTFELDEIQRAFELALARPEERGDLVKAVVEVG